MQAAAPGLPALPCGTSLLAAQQVWWRMQVRYLVMAEEAYRAKFAPAFLSDAQAAAYKELCATLKQPYKNVVRFDGAWPESPNLPCDLPRKGCRSL